MTRLSDTILRQHDGRRMYAAVAIAILFAGCGRADADIAADVRSRLSTASRGAAPTVVVKKGVVLLRGRAGSEAERKQAASAAEGVAGVHRVIDEITLTDEAITTAVEQALRQDPLLAGVPIHVAADGGVVRLVSNATGEDQRQHAVAIARAIPGVTHVEDEMK